MKKINVPQLNLAAAKSTTRSNPTTERTMPQYYFVSKEKLTPRNSLPTKVDKPIQKFKKLEPISTESSTSEEDDDKPSITPNKLIPVVFYRKGRKLPVTSFKVEFIFLISYLSILFINLVKTLKPFVPPPPKKKKEKKIIVREPILVGDLKLPLMVL